MATSPEIAALDWSVDGEACLEDAGWGIVEALLSGVTEPGKTWNAFAMIGGYIVAWSNANWALVPPGVLTWALEAAVAWDDLVQQVYGQVDEYAGVAGPVGPDIAGPAKKAAANAAAAQALLDDDTWEGWLPWSAELVPVQVAQIDAALEAGVVPGTLGWPPGVAAGLIGCLVPLGQLAGLVDVPASGGTGPVGPGPSPRQQVVAYAAGAALPPGWDRPSGALAVLAASVVMPHHLAGWTATKTGAALDALLWHGMSSLDVAQTLGAVGAWLAGEGAPSGAPPPIAKANAALAAAGYAEHPYPSGTGTPKTYVPGGVIPSPGGATETTPPATVTPPSSTPQAGGGGGGAAVAVGAGVAGLLAWALLGR